MRYLSGCLLALLMLPVAAEEIKTSDAILTVLNNPQNDIRVCSRVTALSDNAIGQQECLQNLPQAKETCATAVNNYVGATIRSTEQAGYVARTVLVCQVWTLLGYETTTSDDGVFYVKKPGGPLP